MLRPPFETVRITRNFRASRDWTTSIVNGRVRLRYAYSLAHIETKNDVPVREVRLSGPPAVFRGGKIRAELRSEPRGFRLAIDGTRTILLWALLPILSVVLTAVAWPVWFVASRIVTAIWKRRLRRSALAARG